MRKKKNAKKKFKKYTFAYAFKLENKPSLVSL